MASDLIPVVLHAHFYQPPRDNPWTESVEREPSAAPFHDWNERITNECYSANARARVFGQGERIADIINNFSYLSFNIGPTLFSWLEANAPDTYRLILDADRQSAGLNDGHGSGIAQAYSHAILPLCNERDRNTQIRWGIADFRHRFGRDPEAMWLAETACDVATADALAAHGMRYVILAPYQALRVRKLGEDAWTDVSDGSIDPRRPYRLALPSGREIACFFYDGPTSHALSFEAVLDTSRNLAERLKGASDPNRGANQVVHVATDGETYGHHRHFADRALAYFIKHEAANHGLRLTNYAALLDRMRPTHEVELNLGPKGEGTAWSCSHGVGRWIRDCGCNSGAPSGWNQAWRGPLRRALDGLRDHAAALFEELGGELLRDPWSARDAFISAVLNPDRRTRDAFLAEHGRGTISGRSRVRALKLLEAQRMTQLMYASCGWFFDDLAGLETTQILKYAAMATQLLDEVSGHPYLSKLEEALAEGHSNQPTEGTGADVLRRRVLCWQVTPRHRIAHRAARRLFSDVPEVERDNAFTIEMLGREVLERGSFLMVIGRAKICRIRTEECEELTYAATSLAESEMHCGIAGTDGPEAFEALVEQGRRCFQRPTPTEILRLIDLHLGSAYYSVRDLGDAARAEFIEHTKTGLLDRLGATYGLLYDEHIRAIEAFEAARVEVPRELHLVAEYTLARRFEHAVLEAEDTGDAAGLRTAMAVATAAKGLGIRLTVPRSVEKFTRLLDDAASKLERDRDAVSARRIVELVELAESLHLSVPLDRAQDKVFALSRTDALQSLPADLRACLLEVLKIAES